MVTKAKILIVPYLLGAECSTNKEKQHVNHARLSSKSKTTMLIIRIGSFVFIDVALLQNYDDLVDQLLFLYDQT